MFRNQGLNDKLSFLITKNTLETWNASNGCAEFAHSSIVPLIKCLLFLTDCDVLRNRMNDFVNRSFGPSIAC